jgi:outer membrane beta-barrel protein
MGRRLGLTFFALSSLSISQLGICQERNAARPVESYQVQSQYGPEVAVLNPIFDKNKTFEFFLSLNYSPTSSLYDYIGPAGGVAYHLTRRHSVELWGQYNVYSQTSEFAKSQIINKCQAAGGAGGCAGRGLAIDLPRMIVGAAYSFTPYYTKMHITDMSVIHMDINTFIGPAGVLTEEDRFDGTDGDSNWRIGGMLGVGVRVLARSRWGFRVELRDFIHKAKNVGADDLVNDLQLTAGVSLFLDRFPDYND